VERCARQDHAHLQNVANPPAVQRNDKNFPHEKKPHLPTGPAPAVPTQTKKQTQLRFYKTNTMKKIIILLALVAGLTSFAGTASAELVNLVTNGNFETGTSAGWNKTGSPYQWISSPYHGTAAQGNYAWQYDAYPNQPAYISQTLATLTGVEYRLSYDTMVVGGPPNNFSISIGGQSLFNFVNSPDFAWKTTTIDFTATSNNEVLTIGGASYYLWVEVDNVSVTAAPSAVPEPSQVAASLLLLGTVSTIRRRQTRGAQG
jgi:hypothetical protein